MILEILPLAVLKLTRQRFLIVVIVSLTLLWPSFGWSINAVISTKTNLLSPKIGSVIKSAFPANPGEKRTVVVVEDLHCNAQVQRHIAAIIGELAKTHHLRLVAEEGACGAVDTSVLADLPLEGIKRKLSNSFLDRGWITGAEAYAIMHPDRSDLLGLEDKALYDQSYRVLQGFLNAESLGALFDLREALKNHHGGLAQDLKEKLDILEKMFNISATPDEVQFFRRHRETFQPAAFLKTASAEDCPAAQDLLLLETKLKQVELFYNLTDQRSETFIRNLLGQMQARHQTTALMVTGGYHSAQVLKALESKGIGYYLVRPSYNQRTIVNPYFDLIQQRETPLEKLLAKNQLDMALFSRFGRSESRAMFRLISLILVHSLLGQHHLQKRERDVLKRFISDQRLIALHRLDPRKHGELPALDGTEYFLATTSAAGKPLAVLSLPAGRLDGDITRAVHPTEQLTVGPIEILVFPYAAAMERAVEILRHRPGMTAEPETRQLSEDVPLMQAALAQAALAAKERSWFSAHIGAVLAEDGRIVGRGYNHAWAGGHAEHWALLDALRAKAEEAVDMEDGKRQALDNLFSRIQARARVPSYPRFREDMIRDFSLVDSLLGHPIHQMTFYVTYETCNNCSAMLAALKPERLVMGAPAANPSFRGLNLLQQAGVKITKGVLAKEAGRLTQGYLIGARTFPRLYPMVQSIIRFVYRQLTAAKLPAPAAGAGQLDSIEAANALGRLAVDEVKVVGENQLEIKGRLIGEAGLPLDDQRIRLRLDVSPFDNGTLRNLMELWISGRNTGLDRKDRQALEACTAVGRQLIDKKASPLTVSSGFHSGVYSILDYDVLEGPDNFLLAGLGITTKRDGQERRTVLMADALLRQGNPRARAYAFLHEVGETLGDRIRIIVGDPTLEIHKYLRGPGKRERLALDKEPTPQKQGFLERCLGKAAANRFVAWLKEYKAQRVLKVQEKKAHRQKLIHLAHSLKIALPSDAHADTIEIYLWKRIDLLFTSGSLPARLNFAAKLIFFSVGELAGLRWAMIRHMVYLSFSHRPAFKQNQSLAEMINQYPDHPLPPVILGGTGFLGSHLAETLSQSGQPLLLPVRSHPSQGPLNALSEQHKVVLAQIGDFADPANLALLEQLVARSPIIYHVAANPNAVVNNLDQAEDRLYNNTYLTMLLARLAKKYGTKVVYVSSAHQYGLAGQQLADQTVEEDTPLPLDGAIQTFADKTAEAIARTVEDVLDGTVENPRQSIRTFLSNYFPNGPSGDAWENIKAAIYPVSKILPEQELMNLPAGQSVSLRPTNIYGPDQKGGVIKLFFERMLNGRAVYASTDSRDFVWVDDVAQALQLSGRRLAEGQLKNNEVINIASGQAPLPMKVLLEKIANVLGRSIKVEVKANDSVLVMPRFSIAKSKALLGWAPRINLDQGLKRVAAAMGPRADALENVTGKSSDSAEQEFKGTRLHWIKLSELQGAIHHLAGPNVQIESIIWKSLEPSQDIPNERRFFSIAEIKCKRGEEQFSLYAKKQGYQATALGMGLLKSLGMPIVGIEPFGEDHILMADAGTPIDDLGKAIAQLNRLVGNQKQGKELWQKFKMKMDYEIGKVIATLIILAFFDGHEKNIVVRGLAPVIKALEQNDAEQAFRQLAIAVDSGQLAMSLIDFEKYRFIAAREPIITPDQMDAVKKSVGKLFNHLTYTWKEAVVQSGVHAVGELADYSTIERILHEHREFIKLNQEQQEHLRHRIANLSDYYEEMVGLSALRLNIGSIGGISDRLRQLWNWGQRHVAPVLGREAHELTMDDYKPRADTLENIMVLLFGSMLSVLFLVGPPLMGYGFFLTPEEILKWGFTFSWLTFLGFHLGGATADRDRGWAMAITLINILLLQLPLTWPYYLMAIAAGFFNHHLVNRVLVPLWQQKKSMAANPDKDVRNRQSRSLRVSERPLVSLGKMNAVQLLSLNPKAGENLRDADAEKLHEEISEETLTIGMYLDHSNYAEAGNLLLAALENKDFLIDFNELKDLLEKFKAAEMWNQLAQLLIAAMKRPEVDFTSAQIDYWIKAIENAREIPLAAQLIDVALANKAVSVTAGQAEEWLNWLQQHGRSVVAARLLDGLLVNRENLLEPASAKKLVAHLAGKVELDDAITLYGRLLQRGDMTTSDAWWAGQMALLNRGGKTATADVLTQMVQQDKKAWTTELSKTIALWLTDRTYDAVNLAIAGHRLGLAMEPAISKCLAATVESHKGGLAAKLLLETMTSETNLPSGYTWEKLIDFVFEYASMILGAEVVQKAIVEIPDAIKDGDYLGKWLRKMWKEESTRKLSEEVKLLAKRYGISISNGVGMRQNRSEAAITSGEDDDVIKMLLWGRFHKNGKKNVELTERHLLEVLQEKILKDEPYTICFVCEDNLLRSFLQEQEMKRWLHNNHKKNIKVISGGIQIIINEMRAEKVRRLKKEIYVLYGQEPPVHALRMADIEQADVLIVNKEELIRYLKYFKTKGGSIEDKIIRVNSIFPNFETVLNKTFLNIVSDIRTILIPQLVGKDNQKVAENHFSAIRPGQALLAFGFSLSALAVMGLITAGTGMSAPVVAVAGSAAVMGFNWLASLLPTILPESLVKANPNAAQPKLISFMQQVKPGKTAFLEWRQLDGKMVLLMNHRLYHYLTVRPRWVQDLVLYPTGVLAHELGHQRRPDASEAMIYSLSQLLPAFIGATVFGSLAMTMTSFTFLIALSGIVGGFLAVSGLGAIMLLMQPPLKQEATERLPQDLLLKLRARRDYNQSPYNAILQIVERYHPAWFETDKRIDFDNYKVGKGLAISLNANEMSITLPLWAYRWITNDRQRPAGHLGRLVVKLWLHGYFQLSSMKITMFSSLVPRGLTTMITVISGKLWRSSRRLFDFFNHGPTPAEPVRRRPFPGFYQSA